MIVIRESLFRNIILSYEIIAALLDVRLNKIEECEKILHATGFRHNAYAFCQSKSIEYQNKYIVLCIEVNILINIFQYINKYINQSFI